MTSLPLDRAVDAVLRIAADFDIQFVSETGKRWLTPFFKSTQLPTSFLDFLHTEDKATVQKAMEGLPESFSCDVRVGAAGSQCWVNFRSHRLSAAGDYVLSIVDISSWKTEASSLRHAADHDELTGLPNRATLKRAVAQCIQNNKSGFTVALLGLDGFKRVNDTFGHHTGDAVLVETTRRLLKVLGPTDMLARLGGDEFVMLFPNKNVLAAKQVLKNVLLAVARPYETAPYNAYLGVSVGLAEYPAHGEDYSVMLKNADTAMYKSKNAGKNRVTVFSASEASLDFSITSAMHKGIQAGEFFLEYQPQFDMGRNLVGAEALMRWTNRKWGPVGPEVFIPIAETAGLMPFLGNWALRSACHQLKLFHTLAPDFVMSVNVSPMSPLVSAPKGKSLASFNCWARWRSISTKPGSSRTGSLSGGHTKLVTPPATAARSSDASMPSCSKPGSFTRALKSTKPGSSHKPCALMLSPWCWVANHWAGMSPRWTMCAPWMATSAMLSRPLWGSMTRALVMTVVFMR